jgi:hypothetical protein
MNLLNKSLVGLLLLIFLFWLIGGGFKEGHYVQEYVRHYYNYWNNYYNYYYGYGYGYYNRYYGYYNRGYWGGYYRNKAHHHLYQTPNLHNMKYVGGGCCRFKVNSKATTSVSKGYMSPTAAVAACSNDKKCKGVDLGTPTSTHSGNTTFHKSDNWPTSHGMACTGSDYLCYRKEPTCIHTEPKPQSTKWKCLTVDETCTRSGNPSLLGAVQIPRSTKNYWQEISAICDKTPNCQYIQYDGKTATFFKAGGCPSGQRAIKPGLDVWERVSAAPQIGSTKTKSIFPAYEQKSSSGTTQSGSKGTVTAAKGKIVVPYAFGVDEEVCKKYCDTEQSCKVIHWEASKTGKLSKCFLRGGPAEPKKFSKEKFTNQEGFVKFDQNIIKNFLGCK